MEFTFVTLYCIVIFLILFAGLIKLARSPEVRKEYAIWAIDIAVFLTLLVLLVIAMIAFKGWNVLIVSISNTVIYTFLAIDDIVKGKALAFIRAFILAALSIAVSFT